MPSFCQVNKQRKRRVFGWQKSEKIPVKKGNNKLRNKEKKGGYESV